MKKLILFTLFAIGVCGQDNTVITLKDSVEFSYCGTIETDWLESQIIVDYSGASKYIIKLWDEYRAKCYADSTPVLGFPYIIGKQDSSGALCGIMKKDTLWWEHKLTNGFEGFIEYLRGKVK